MTSDADLVLLILIAESPGINGYEIRQRVQQRGLDAWAGVGPSSIYNGVRRITELGLVKSRPDIAKQRKGPTGAALTLSKKGDRVVRGDLVATLAMTREHDPRFNIALAGTDLLDTSVVVASLHKRADFLSAEHDRLSATREGQRPLPDSAELLFGRILHALDSERSWTQATAERLQRTTGTEGNI